MVVGQLSVGHGLYGGGELVVQPPSQPVPAIFAATLRTVLDEAAAAGVRVDPDRAPVPAAAVAYAPAVDRFEGHLDGGGATFTVVRSGVPEPLPVPASQRHELGALLQLRDAAVDVLQTEAASLDDTDRLAALRQALNERYDHYAATYGPINRFTEIRASRRGRTAEALVVQRRTPPAVRTFRTDPHAPLTLARERFEDATQTATKADNHARPSRPPP